MKKTLLVAALLAGFAGAAQAETSVTLYGIVDAGIGYQRITGTLNGQDYTATRTGVLSGVESGSRWGLRGTEDLGSGLQAVFQLESGFDIGTGQSQQGNRLFGRQATVGLQSESWGRLDFGRQSNIAYKYLADVVSPFGLGFAQAQAGATFSQAATLRFDNMVMYQTPNYSGFQFGIGYSFNSDGPQTFRINGQDNGNSRAWTTGLRYTNGPLAVALTYDEIRSPDNGILGGAVVEPGVNVRAYALGLSYDFGPVKAYAGIGQTRNGWLAGGVFPDNQGLGFITEDGMRVNSYTVGLSAPIGAQSRIFASWGMADPSRENGGADSKQNIYSLGYTYAVSKRTDVYAYGSYANHVAFEDDLKSTQVGIGLRHQF